ncbi:acyl-CoA thioester hydrolase [Knoellia remsis]|uniref:Acyl-CoA thioester hydrolase n=1 Tax=Knoellia remsis TaxID=407159 RepID=A0A2T0UTX6_9MICO|nr:acyl-CoA thioesterase [Knoellia remsis]PRY61376.1 acyl-CoA thioester hydrolase [Knoellia remsis]
MPQDPTPDASARPYRTEVPLRWSDMDAYGHVNNVQYLRLLEDARVIGFREWFGTEKSVVDAGVVVSRHEIEYVAPLTYRPQPIEVDMWVTGVFGAGFNLGYAVRDPEALGEKVYAVAETGLVLYDFRAEVPRRLSEGEREVLRIHQGEPVPFRWSRR